MSHQIKLIVGLGNPGPEYENTRHNAGDWFVDAIAEQTNVLLKTETKFKGLAVKTSIANHACHLLIPTTYMNHSGQAVRAMAQFYKLEPQEILIVHDELDLPPGTIKLKMDGGGHGGHNGLRDIISQLHSREFLRLRIGIGHPGHKDQVTDYVLHRASKNEKIEIDHAIHDGLKILPLLINGDYQAAMQQLHTQ